MTPTGTVTFLFTDVVGSTKLWDAYPEAMREALRRHDVIIRAAVEPRRGHIFSTAGDGFVAAFWSADEAVSAAAEIHDSLARESWPPPTRLSVRVGVHTGVAEERNGDYFGPPLNRAARLMALAQPGQTLLSAATAALVRSVEVRSLGEHRLRDLSMPEQVFQLGGQSFPPLTSTLSRWENQPSSPPLVIGRDALVERVATVLEDARLVTLVGPGGVGKTTLALAVAATRAASYADGVSLVELASLASDGDVAGAVAHSLGLAGTWPPGSHDNLGPRVAGQELLLLLDSCEHVIDGAVAVASALAGSASRVHVLATSREPLAVAGERVVQVPPLDLDGPAVELFWERAVEADPDLVRTHEAEREVAELVRRLDGVPLALELAAAQLRSMTLPELRGSLDVGSLASPRRDLPGRHRSLRATLEWSCSLLEADELTLFERCAVFAGSFDRDAAAGVCSGPELPPSQVRELLGRLADRSLLVVERDAASTARFRMLDTMRELGRDRLAAASDREQLAARHAHYFTERAVTIGAPFLGPDERSRAAVLLRLMDDAAIAFEWLITRDPAAAARLASGYAEVSSRWLWPKPAGWAKRVWPELAVDDPSRPWIAASLAWTAIGSADWEAARRVGRLAADSHQDHRGWLHARLADWSVDLYTRGVAGDTGRALDLQTCATRLGDPVMIAFTLAHVSWAWTSNDIAVEQLGEAIQMAEAAGSDCIAAYARYFRTFRTVGSDPETTARELDLVLDTTEAMGDAFIANQARERRLAITKDDLGTAGTGREVRELIVSWWRGQDLTRVRSALDLAVLVLFDSGRRGDAVELAAELTEAGPWPGMNIKVRRRVEALLAAAREPPPRDAAVERPRPRRSLQHAYTFALRALDELIDSP